MSRCTLLLGCINRASCDLTGYCAALATPYPFPTRTGEVIRPAIQPTGLLPQIPGESDDIMEPDVGIDELACMINGWANETFPGRTDQSMYLKMYGEVAEMIEATDKEVGGEIADVFIMLLDFAVRKNVNLTQAIRDKMDINMQRRWERNKLGAYSHVK